MAPSDHHHRASLKQANKSFKSKHASKGSLKAAAKGKVIAEPTNGHSHKQSVSSKKARLNANAQKREAKRKSTSQDVRFFSTSSGGSSVPRIITIIPLLDTLSPKRFLSNLLPTLDLPSSELDPLLASLAETGTYLLRAPRFKTNLQINLLPALNVWESLDAALISDYVVLLLSSVDEVQLEGEGVLRCLQGQVGGVDIISCVQAPEDQPIIPSTKQLIHKSLLSFTKYFFPSVMKMHSTDTPAEAALFARAVCEAAPTGGRDDGRGYLVAEGKDGVQWTEGEGSDGKGRLQVVGTVRGGCLSADRLVHIPGRGDFQIESILPPPPSSLAIAHKHHQQSMTLDTPSEPLSTPTDQADDLTSTNIPDTSMNEQTWPTEEEIGSAPALTGEGKRMKRVPKGTSAYQAAWIFDDEDEEGDEDGAEDDDMDGVDGVDEEDEMGDGGDVEETEEIELDSRVGEGHKDLDPEEEEREYAQYLKGREKQQAEDSMFPDEIDTPRHLPARTRFQRYRGLKSFRTSPWDPYEALPENYGRVFQFENFNGTGKRVEKDGRESGVKAGTRVLLVLKDVPREVYEGRGKGPFIIHGLLQHEHKQSVLHFAVQRNTEYTEPVRAKDPLVLCVGPRRYVVKPLYSQHVRGGGKGVNNVHKSEKFLRPGGAVVATTFGPVCFGKVPCLLLKDEGEGQPPSLVAMGTSLPPDPTRIIAKRIILTGHPLKIHKKTATIRYMFFNRDDVEWFKSVELRTKFGRIGHIQEALGTHGYYKAHFDGPIQGMDTICMSLYKRQFPKWAEEVKAGAGTGAGAGHELDEMDMEV